MSATDTDREASFDSEASNAKQQYFGKYRGTVLDNVDPMQIGRLMVMVPDISALLPTSWALPCFPSGGIQMGMMAVPPIGAGVWIEFEQGDPDQPIWVGCFYGSIDEVPTLSLLAPSPIPSITLQTPLANGIIVSDLPGPTGGIMLKSTTGAMLMVNDTGIYIQNGQGAAITLIGPTVTINEGALTVV